MSQIVNGSLIPTGQFCTIEFITKEGEVRKLNGRTGVNKYNKSKRSNVDLTKFFLVYTRNGSRAFDALRAVNKNNIVSIRAHGIKAERNTDSVYCNTL